MGMTLPAGPSDDLEGEAYKPLAEINVTPFVDVMLVLLIVFMVAAPLMVQGVPVDLHEKIRALQREYDAHHHEIPGAHNASLPDRFGLTEFLVDRFAIAGAPGDCVAQIRRAMDAGARQFLITGFVPDPRAFMRRWRRDVADRVAG